MSTDFFSKKIRKHIFEYSLLLDSFLVKIVNHQIFKMVDQIKKKKYFLQNINFAQIVFENINLKLVGLFDSQNYTLFSCAFIHCFCLKFL